MATKTFKFGEYVRGCSDIKVTINEKKKDSYCIEITTIDFDKSKDSTAMTKEYGKLRDFFENLTTPYYSEKILTWIESKTELTNKNPLFY